MVVRQPPRPIFARALLPTRSRMSRLRGWARVDLTQWLHRAAVEVATCGCVTTAGATGGRSWICLHGRAWQPSLHGVTPMLYSALLPVEPLFRERVSQRGAAGGALSPDA